MSDSERVNFGSNPLEGPTIKREAKSTVFTDLFSDPKYAFLLYLALHPDDKTSTQDDVRIITLDNVLTDKEYNDLGFCVGDRLIILAEHQSTWSDNYPVRALIYLAQTLNEYLKKAEANLYGVTKVKLPKPELYVIYTGDRKSCPEVMSLNDTFGGGGDYSIDVRVKILRDGKEGDIICQYVAFTRVLTEQIALYGKGRKALEETIRICKDRNILREYLKSREKEIVTIMITLFDHQEIQERYVADERRKAYNKGGEEKSRLIAQNMLSETTLSLELIAECTGLPLDEVEELATEVRK